VTPVPAQSDLLAIWEQGEGERTAGRALALLAGAAAGPDGVDPGAVPVGRRDASLIALRESLFGSRFTGVTSCPACGEEIELTFDASEVRRSEAGAGGTFHLGAAGYEVTFRLPTAADLLAIEKTGALDSARAQLFARCLAGALYDGQPVPAAAVPDQVIEAVAARMAELDPQADVAFDLDCPSCAHGWREPFDVVTFLWSEVAAWARRLLADVHALASAYGWSESEILRLTPVRRNAYLEML
jgi:hypothetical protein